MRNSKRSGVVAACVVAATPFLSTSVSAGGLDGSSDIVCALTEVVGCVEQGSCLQGRAKGFDLPGLFILDAEKKVIQNNFESGDKSVSPVKGMERSGDHLVLQGVENGRGWDIAINVKTGTMSGAVVGDAVSILVFGVCTAP